MQFYTKKRSRPVVPIVSLIDILAILLIFFIVTTTFKERKAMLAIDLPSTKTLVTSFETTERLAIAIRADEVIYLGDQEIDVEELAAELAALIAARPEAQLELKADEAVPLRLLVRVWDNITTAGFKIKDVPARIIVAPANP
ncbi:hypothetical protein BH23VER1_BH23VER1_23150 [soil metagenome]